jgi:beta-N-acetylhexosaminidase
MLIAVDEEGGTVTRVSRYSQFRPSKFASPRELYAQGGLELIVQTEEEKCTMLKSLGINVNLAPVCDVTTDPDAFMYSRSLGESPEITGQFIAVVTKTMDTYQLGGVLKHFPGYGNNTDTHTGIAVDDRTLEELESVDLIPFAAGIEAGCQAIMVSHTFVNCLDTEHPASLSPDVIAYLRNDMGFEGVIITDDLVMEAITDLYGAEEAAVLAVLAGNDLLCSSEYWIQYPAVLEAVENGRISAEILDAAVLRVLQWKYDLNLLDLLT